MKKFMKKTLVGLLISLLAWGLAVWDALVVWAVFDWATGAFTLDKTSLFILTAAVQVPWYLYLKRDFDE